MKNKRTVLTMLLARRVCGWSARQLLKPRPIRTAFKSSTRAAPLMSVVDKESMDYVDVDTELAAPAEDVVLGEETPIEDAEPEKDPMAIEGRISDRQAERLAQRGITTFTEIQHRSYEPVFEGRDLLGKSRTGTGKTVAFGLPIIEKLAESVIRMAGRSSGRSSVGSPDLCKDLGSGKLDGRRNRVGWGWVDGPSDRWQGTGGHGCVGSMVGAVASASNKKSWRWRSWVTHLRV